MKNFQKGAQGTIVVMLIALLVLVFVLQAFAKKVFFQTLKEEVPTKQAVVPYLSDGMFVDVLVGGVKVNAEIAKSAAKRTKGLSKRYNLDEGKGMLFVFEKAGKYPFWNKDTYIPLDILWIENNKVVHILEGLPVYNEKTAITEFPKAEANFVLEVSEGFVKKNNIKLGDSFKLQN